MATKYIDFNLNDLVRIKLTPTGRKILMDKFNLMRKEHPGLFSRDYLPDYLREDSEGWSKCEMWMLMQVFGDKMHDEYNLPFNLNIQLEVNNE